MLKNEHRVYIHAKNKLKVFIVQTQKKIFFWQITLNLIKTYTYIHLVLVLELTLNNYSFF